MNSPMLKFWMGQLEPLGLQLASGLHDQPLHKSKPLSRLIQCPTTRLRLEYHDLMSLFEFLDNGDGEITCLRSHVVGVS